jgi:hypothetical protein
MFVHADFVDTIIAILGSRTEIVMPRPQTVLLGRRDSSENDEDAVGGTLKPGAVLSAGSSVEKQGAEPGDLCLALEPALRVQVVPRGHPQQFGGGPDRRHVVREDRPGKLGGSERKAGGGCDYGGKTQGGRLERRDAPGGGADIQRA